MKYSDVLDEIKKLRRQVTVLLFANIALVSFIVGVLVAVGR